jgi:hypothetical protein
MPKLERFAGHVTGGVQVFTREHPTNMLKLCNNRKKGIHG